MSETNLPEWLEKWLNEWLHKMTCQGVDPRVREGFKKEISWLHEKLTNPADMPSRPVEEATEILPEGPEPVLRWVKCADRLPELPNPLPPDTPEEHGILFINRIHSASYFWFPSYGQSAESILANYNDTTLYGGPGWSIRFWEWLEQIPASILQPASKETETLGRILEDARIKSGYTLEQAAEASGVPFDYINQLEKDKYRQPSAHALYKLASLYAIDLKKLLMVAGIIIKKSDSKPIPESLPTELPEGEFLDKFIQLVGGECVKVYFLLGLKHGFESGIRDSQTDEKFVFSFKHSDADPETFSRIKENVALQASLSSITAELSEMTSMRDLAKKEYDLTLKEVQTWKDECNTVGALLEGKNVEIARLKDALKWYADHGNYCCDEEGNTLATAWEDGKITQKAKKALEYKKEEQK